MSLGPKKVGTKLIYLRVYLKGYAFRVMQHLSITDENFSSAINILKNEFLDIPFIIDENLKTLINPKPGFDTKFLETRSYLNNMRALLYDLQSLGVNFLEEGSAGSKLVGNIIFAKLPLIVKKELTYKIGSIYSTLTEIFEHHNETIKTILNTFSINWREKFNTHNVNNKKFQGTDYNKSNTHRPKFNKYETTVNQMRVLCKILTLSQKVIV